MPTPSALSTALDTPATGLQHHSFKVIAMLRKKAGLSQADFIAYYEQHHAPLILQLLPGIVEYRRNFAQFEHAYAFESAAAFDFDVLTEIRFRDRASYDAAMATAAHPDIAQRIADDEAQFLDRSGSRMFTVQEACSTGLPTGA